MSSAYLPLSLALNYITVNVDAADPLAFPSRSGLRYYLSLMVPDSYLSNTFEELVEFEGSETPPKQVAGGTIYRGAFFELQDQLDSLLERTAPTFGQTGISVCDKLVTPYYVKARIENNGTLIYQAQTPVQYAIKAGVAETDFAAYRDTFFTEYIGAGCRFLTWAENGKRVQYDQPEFLYWLCNCSPLPSGLRLRVQTYPVEDLETVDVYTAATLTDITPMTVYGLAVGPAALGIENRVGTVASYSVWLEDLAGNKLTEERLYRIDPDYRRNVRFVLFANSLGGFDTLCLTGTGQESLKVVRNISDRNPDYSFSPSYAEKIINETTGERQLVVNTGFLSQYERTYLQELALTKEAYLVTDRAFLPLLPTMESVWASVDDENAAGRVLTFTYANPERNFSQLPTKNIAGTIRETGWRPKSSACLLDGNGKRTGMKAVTMIEQYYLDDGSRVVDAPIRPNVPGRVGYIPPDYSLDCQTTPFLSAAITRPTSFVRATCTGGQQGGPAVVDLPAGLFGSEISQADADAKAEAEYNRLNTQAYADQYGSCIAAPETYEWAVPAGKWHYRSVRPDKTDVVFRNADNYPIWGNSYFMQSQGGANTYAFGTNDLDFPANNNGVWLFRVYGPVGTSKRIRMYRNAVLVQDRTVIMNRDGYEQVGVPSGFSFASGDKFLIRADDL